MVNGMKGCVRNRLFVQSQAPFKNHTQSSENRGTTPNFIPANLILEDSSLLPQERDTGLAVLVDQRFHLICRE